MILNAALVAAASEQFQILFNKGLAAVGTPLWPRIATRQPSSTAINTYGWLKDIPGMRLWVGDRVHHNLAAQAMTVPNLDFELTVDIPANWIADNELGNAFNPIQNLGFESARDPDRRIIAKLLAGFVDLCHDGKAFFAADHPHPQTGHAAWGNKETHKFNAARFKAGYDAMVIQTNAAGQPAGVRATHLIHGAVIADDVFAVLKAQRLTADVDNPHYNKVQTIETELFADSEAWMLLDLSRPFLLPLMMQIRQEPVFAARDKITDENVFEKRVLTYGVNDRKAAAFALPQLAYGSTGAVAN